MTATQNQIDNLVALLDGYVKKGGHHLKKLDFGVLRSVTVKINTITQTILTAEEGHYLTNGETYGKTVVLPSAENAENWHEITEETYNAIVKKQEEHYGRIHCTADMRAAMPSHHAVAGIVPVAIPCGIQKFVRLSYRCCGKIARGMGSCTGLLRHTDGDCPDTCHDYHGRFMGDILRDTEAERGCSGSRCYGHDGSSCDRRVHSSGHDGENAEKVFRKTK